MKLSPLAQRLMKAARSPGVPWKFLVENVPVWPADPPALAQRTPGGGDYVYAPSQGTEALRRALRRRAADQGFDVGSESILVTNGGLDGIGLVARHLAASGARRAVCAGPVLRSVADLLHASGMQVAVTDWAALIDGQEWARMGLGPADVFYINTPHNPTGECLGWSAAESILEARPRLGFAIIFDVVYDSFHYTGQAPPAPLALVRDWEDIYGVNSFSKNYGVPGLRVGWITGEAGAVSDATARLEWEKISVSTGAQFRAAALCEYGNSALVDRVRNGRDILLAWAAENDVTASPWHGGVQLWADMGTGDSEEFADRLMDEHQVVIATGANYFPRCPARLRIPAGVPPSLLAESLPLLADVKRNWR